MIDDRIGVRKSYTSMKRRDVLKIIPAAMAGSTFSGFSKALDSSLLTKAGFTISVQCWSFNRFSAFEAIEKAAQAGASGVEIYQGQVLSSDLKGVKVGAGMPQEAFAAMVEHAAKHKIAFVNHGVLPIAADEAEARKIFEFAKSLGLYGLTTESLGSIDTIEKLVKEYDIKVCFHNHPKPTALWNPDTISKAIETRDERIGFCADIGHWASSGLNPLDVIKKIAPRVHAFHLKDRTSITEKTPDTIFGKGIIDLKGILDEVRKHGFKGNVTIEYENNWEKNVPDITECVTYLKNYSASV